MLCFEPLDRCASWCRLRGTNLKVSSPLASPECPLAGGCHLRRLRGTNLCLLILLLKKCYLWRSWVHMRLKGTNLKVSYPLTECQIIAPKGDLLVNGSSENSGRRLVSFIGNSQLISESHHSRGAFWLWAAGLSIFADSFPELSHVIASRSCNVPLAQSAWFFKVHARLLLPFEEIFNSPLEAQQSLCSKQKDLKAPASNSRGDPGSMKFVRSAPVQNAWKRNLQT